MSTPVNLSLLKQLCYPFWRIMKPEPTTSGDIKAAAIDGLALGFSAVPIGFAYGILAHKLGLSLVQTVAFSGIVCAGASQMAALNLMSLGSGLFQIYICTLLINFRFSVLSAALSRYLRQTRGIWFPFLAFTVVTFTVAPIITRGEKYKRVEVYMLTIQTTFLLWWTLSSLVGYLLPGILPPDLRDALSFAFPASLIGMIFNLIPISKPISRAIVVGYTVAFSAGILAVALYFLFPAWSLPLAVVITATIGALIQWKRQ